MRRTRIRMRLLYAAIAMLIVGVLVVVAAKRRRVHRIERERRQAYIRHLETQLDRERYWRQREMEARVARQTPEILDRLRRAVAEFSADHWEPLLDVGAAYRTGSYPLFRPNLDLAMQCFRAAARSPDAAVAGQGQTKYIECRVDTIAAVDIAGKELPTSYAHLILQQAEEAARNAPSTAWATPKQQPHQPHQQLHQQPHQQPHQPVVPTFVPVEIVVPIDIRPDAQNVHDHSVTAGMRRVLRSTTANESGDDVVDTVRELIIDSNAMPERERLDALDVLDSLSKDMHSELGHSERDALAKVWAQLETLDDGIKENARETLVRQLASGIEDGTRVCSTGKIARIVGTLDGIVGDAPQTKPMWAVRQELAGMAAKVRDDGGSADDFARAAQNVYVGDLGLSKNVVGPIIQEMQLGFD